MRWCTGCVIWHPVNLRGLTSTQQRGLQSSREQLTLAAPSTAPGLWLGPPWVAAVECQLGNDPGHAVLEPSPRSQPLCFWLAGHLGSHYCQFQLGTGHMLAVRFWENVTSCFIIFCTDASPELALGPSSGAGPEQWSSGCFTGRLIH